VCSGICGVAPLGSASIVLVAYKALYVRVCVCVCVCVYIYIYIYTMVRTCKENVRKQAATESLRMGTRGNTKKGKI
jgi:hypothetical protein